MMRPTLALALLVGLSSAAVAGPMPADRHVAERSSSQRYWLSKDLNKLVFWHVPDRDASAEGQR